jgi:hypothetical protein
MTIVVNQGSQSYVDGILIKPKLQPKNLHIKLAIRFKVPYNKASEQWRCFKHGVGAMLNMKTMAIYT